MFGVELIGHGQSNRVQIKSEMNCDAQVFAMHLNFRERSYTLSWKNKPNEIEHSQENSSIWCKNFMIKRWNWIISESPMLLFGMLRMQQIKMPLFAIWWRWWNALHSVSIELGQFTSIWSSIFAAPKLEQAQFPGMCSCNVCSSAIFVEWQNCEFSTIWYYPEIWPALVTTSNIMDELEQ